MTSAQALIAIGEIEQCQYVQMCPLVNGGLFYL